AFQSPIPGLSGEGWAEMTAVAGPLRGMIGRVWSGNQMTRKEIKLALKQMDDRGAYGLRVVLHQHTPVLPHPWYREGTDKSSAEEPEGEAEREGDQEGLLRVVARGRQALIAISRIVLIEMVPPP